MIPSILFETFVPRGSRGGAIGAMIDWMIAFLLPFLTVMFTALFYQYALIRIRGQLRMYLEEIRGLGVELPICLNCGYAADQSLGSCPECGAQL